MQKELKREIFRSFKVNDSKVYRHGAKLSLTYIVHCSVFAKLVN